MFVPVATRKMAKTRASGRPQFQATEPHNTSDYSEAYEHKISTLSAFVANARASCSRAKNKIFRKTEAFRFCDLPDELGIRIIAIALELQAPRHVFISRPPRPKKGNCMIDEDTYDRAGLYSLPHPFTLVSVKFRQLTFMARKPAFAVFGPRGGLIAPARIVCDPEKDDITIFQSVLEYRSGYHIPDLVRFKTPLMVFCRSILDPAAITRLCSFPDDMIVFFIHEAQYLGPHYIRRPKHFVQHGLLPDEEERIKTDLNHQYRSHRDPQSNPHAYWVRLSYFPLGRNPRGPVTGWVYLQTKLTKDKATLWLHFKRRPEYGAAEIIRRRHWVQTGHWSKKVIIDKRTGKCKCDTKKGRPHWQL